METSEIKTTKRKLKLYEGKSIVVLSYSKSKLLLFDLKIEFELIYMEAGMSD